MGVTFGDLAKGDPELRNFVESTLAPLRADGLGAVLSAAVGAAHEVINCEYAAVAVFAADGRAERYVPVGMSSELAEQIGRLPENAGLAGAVVADSRVIRIPDVHGGSGSADLSLHHPLVRTLLAVPLLMRGRCEGALYFSEPRDSSEFTDDDQRVAEVVAAAITDEIERDRTQNESLRRERWETAGAELVRDLATGRHRAPLHLISDQMRELSESDTVLVVEHRDDDMMIVSAAAGSRAGEWIGLELPAATSLSAQIIDTGRPMTVVRARDSAQIHSTVRDRLKGPSSLLMVPMVSDRARRGVLVLIRDAYAPFTNAETGMATMLAGQVALALDVAELQGNRDQARLLAERDRIARDLHDHVIQRLFALGMSLQTASMAMPPDEAQRMHEGVDEIDDTIRQIRATIYHLSGPLTSERASLRVRASRLIEELESVLGFRPEFSVIGAVDFGVDDEALIADCIAVLREALTNVARHADANRAWVSLAATGRNLTIEIRDDGRGLGTVSRRSGLANMRTRAEDRGGSLDIAPNEPRGTNVRWSVPLEDVPG